MRLWTFILGEAPAPQLENWGRGLLQQLSAVQAVDRRASRGSARLGALGRRGRPRGVVALVVVEDLLRVEVVLGEVREDAAEEIGALAGLVEGGDRGAVVAFDIAAAVGEAQVGGAGAGRDAATGAVALGNRGVLTTTMRSGLAVATWYGFATECQRLLV